MKKSNKLLLGGFLTLILLVTGIHIALFAKYKNGNYTIYKHEDNRNDRMISFQNVSKVTFRNVTGATIHFGDQAAIEKGKEDVITYEQTGDSLIITGKDYDDYPDGRRLVHVTLPYNFTVSAINSFLNFEKGENTSVINPVIHLQRSHAIFFNRNAPFQMGNVKIVATDSSLAGFQSNTMMDQLDVQLSKSSLEYNEGNAGQVSIITDSLSRLSLQSKHFLKAKITTVPSNL